MVRRKRSRKGCKVLECACKREAYEVADDVTTVTCWRCVYEKNNKNTQDIVKKKEEREKLLELEKENKKNKIEKTPSKKPCLQESCPKVTVNPIDPKTGRPRRGRPPKRSTLV